MKVLVADPIAQQGIDILAAKNDVDVRIGLKREQLIEIAGDYEAIVTRSETKVTAEVIAAAPKLKVVGRAGVGVDNIDVQAATEKGILVVNVPGANTVAAAEHALALILALARHVPQACDDLKGGNWKRSKFAGVELRGKTLGIIGLGRIGTEVANRARAFEMRILAYDPYVTPARAEKIGAEVVPLEALLRESDFVSLHTAKTQETTGLLGPEEIAAMKEGARLINCARGGLVDEDALYSALKEGKLAGAALDVFAQEPPGKHPLFELPNVIATPHLAGSTLEAQEANGVIIAELINQALAGEPVLSAVNIPNVPPQEAKALEPYLPLAETLGRFYAQALPGPLAAVSVNYSGDVAGLPYSLLTNTVLKGLLSGIVADPVNHINARVIAARRGIQVSESASAESAGYTNRIDLRVTAGNGVKGGAVKPVTRSVSGHVSSTGIRIVGINDFQVDFAPTARMILAWNVDQPGVIGKVGTVLGARGINIAGMQVGRASIGGQAVMILQVDDQVEDGVLEAVAAVPGIMEARRVELAL